MDKSIDDPHDNVYHPSVEFWKNFSKPPDESTFEDWIAAERDARTRYFENLKAAPPPPPPPISPILLQMKEDRERAFASILNQDPAWWT